MGVGKLDNMLYHMWTWYSHQISNILPWTILRRDELQWQWDGDRNMSKYACLINVKPRVSFILVFAVEGVWSAWGAWGACTTTCNTGSRTRTRGYTGGQPCSGSSSDMGNCVSKFFTVMNQMSVKKKQIKLQIFIWHNNLFLALQRIKSLDFFEFQLKVYGRPGIIGVLAREHAIQTPGLVQSSIMVICHALELQVK